MTEVMSLPISEPVRFDRQRIANLVRILGEPAAPNMIRSALDEIEVALALIEQTTTCGNDADALSHTEILARLGWKLGLPTLAVVAQNLRDSIRQRDDIAVAAIRARLRRVGNRSLAMMRRDPDLS